IEPTKDETILDQNIAIENNNTITQVKLVKKEKNDLSSEEAEVKKDEKVSEGLDALSDELVEPVADKQSQQPALTKTSFDPDVEAEIQADNTAENRSEEHTSELQSRENLVCRLLLEKKKR